jgi:dihydrofolate reductase
MAMSVNGLIARENGSGDFLSDENWQTFSSLVNEFSCFVVGQHTYEAVKQWPEAYSFDDFPDATKIVVSDDPSFQVDEGYFLAKSPQDALEQLDKKGFEKALLTGGAHNNSSFARVGLIDEVILNVEPTAIGKGIPLFAPQEFELRLELLDSKKLRNNILQVHYRVSKDKS